MTTARLNIPFVLPSQAQKHVTVNTAFAKLDALVQTSATSQLSTPPVSPTDGDTYLVGASATGDWAGQEDAIALYDTDHWAFVAPADGWTCYVISQDTLYRFLSGWAPLPAPDELSLLGINGTADATNKLLVQSQGVVFNHVGSHQRTTLNKNSASDDASFNFQTGYSSRALTGLLGSDDYTIKVSPDGSAFHLGLCVDTATGGLSLGAVADHSASVTIHDPTTPELRLLTDAEDDVTIGFYDAQAEGSQNTKLIWSAASNTFSIKTNNTDALKIAANGTVSTPQTPVLSYSRNVDISWGGNAAEHISFNTERELQGNITINPAKDEITTPEVGTYLVSVRLATINGTTNSGDAWAMELRQNGSNIIPSGTNLFCPNQSGTTGVETTQVATLPVIAAADDTFEIWVTSINSNATLTGAAVEFVKIG
ncbi:MAG: DUF2793 domain-containing protein [Paracoccaceae bacterium]